MLDLRIDNALVVDGTGAPWFRGAVGTKDGTIERIFRGDSNATAADEVIDADGSVVCPGFIDTHSHSDLRVFTDPQLEPKLRQGITTEILGQDGFTMAPMHREGGVQEWKKHLTVLAGESDVDWTWEDTADYLDAIEDSGLAPNLGMLTGHGTVRYNVLGMSDREPTHAELKEMADLVSQSLEQGALGFSTGLVYAPQINATTHEVQTLASELEPYGRPFVAHIRSESEDIWEAIDEFVDIGADEEVPLHLSHYKLSGRSVHGEASRTNELLEAARERGVDITAEQYPYTAGNTMLASILPSWVQADGPDETIERLSEPKTRDRIRKELNEEGVDWDTIELRNLDRANTAKYNGRDVASVAKERDSHPVDVVCELLITEELDVAMLIHSMSESDVREIMQNERVCVATDGLFGASPHPRTYGTYPRILGHYVREENVLTLEEAIRKMTSLPARAMGLQRKGLVRPGMDADLVVFDPARVGSPATFENPRRHPQGVTHVLVDGTFVVRNEKLTERTPGSVIRA